MSKEKYLRRIAADKSPIARNLEGLKFLQRQHLLNVPFENLDIHWKKSIVLEIGAFYEKIVGENRGGFCYELNALFFELLKEMGFQCKIISARVSKENGEFGAEYDHLAIIARIDDEEYLVDVGFGAFTAEPLRFVLDIKQQDDNGVFLIKKIDDKYYEITKKNGDAWRSEYIFTPLSRDLNEFTEIYRFHQFSPESHFTKGKICSAMTINGRKTLTDKRFVETKNTEKIETAIDSDEKFDEILQREFGIRRDFQ